MDMLQKVEILVYMVPENHFVDFSEVITSQILHILRKLRALNRNCAIEKQHALRERAVMSIY